MPVQSCTLNRMLNFLKNIRLYAGHPIVLVVYENICFSIFRRVGAHSEVNFSDRNALKQTSPSTIRSSERNFFFLLQPC